MNGYNFTERVRAVIAHSRAEAKVLSHPYVEPSHLLLGLLRENNCVSAAVLDSLGVDRPAMIDRLHAAINHTGPSITVGPGETDDLPFSSGSKKVLELSMAVAREESHTYVGVEHLLLGILRRVSRTREPGSDILVAAGVTYEKALQETLRLLGPGVAVPRARRVPKAEINDARSLADHVDSVTILLELGEPGIAAHKFASVKAAIQFLRALEK